MMTAVVSSNGITFDIISLPDFTNLTNTANLGNGFFQKIHPILYILIIYYCMMKKKNDAIDMGGGISNDRHGKIQRRNADPWEARPLADSVLRLIWTERLISRAEIARRFKLSRSTVTEIVKDLLQSGFVIERKRGKSQGGRRPILLEFQDEIRCILGVDIGATHVNVVLTDLQGRILERREKIHPVRTDPEGTRTLIFELCDACLAAWKEGNGRLLSIGVAVPSPVDPLNPDWISEVVIPNWQGRSELGRLNRQYNVPVHIDNDANLGALAEYRWGAGRDVSDLIYIKIAHGIGAGYILRGEIYRGAGGFAGEMGHMPIDSSGEPCVCGLRGCLANYVRARALEKRAKALIDKFPDSVLSDTQPTITAIEDAAIAEDPLALQIVQETAEYLAIAVAGWCNLMNPKMVVIGGGFSRIGDLFLKPLRDHVQSFTHKSPVAAAEIKTGELGSEAVAIGAATLALEEAFATANFFRN